MIKKTLLLSLVVETNDDAFLAFCPGIQGAFAEGDTVLSQPASHAVHRHPDLPCRIVAGLAAAVEYLVSTSNLSPPPAGSILAVHR